MKKREEQLQKMILAGIKAQWERLDDPKNNQKGLFPETLGDIKNGIEEETLELQDELNPVGNFNYERIREEAADLKNWLDDLIMVCDEEIEENKKK